MAFSNQVSSIVTDSKGSLNVFLLTRKGIELIYYDKMLGISEKKYVVEDSLEEFDVIIDHMDQIFLAYQRNDGKIEIISSKNGIWHKEELIKNVEEKAFNLSIIKWEDSIHTFFCVPKKDSNRVYNIFHGINSNGTWIVDDIGSITREDVLNPFEVREYDNYLFLSYYDLVDGVEQLFIKKYDLLKNEWVQEQQITYSKNKKLYLDLLIMYDEIHLTYSENNYGNYVIKYERHRLNKNKIEKELDHSLSNPSNCMYPTLVFYGDDLWTIWIEHENIMSAFTEDIGKNWSEPYLFSESKSEIFSRYKFVSNNSRTNKTYKLNYSFGKQYPNISFLGFGSLDNAVRTPLRMDDKKKPLDNSQDNVSNYEKGGDDSSHEESSVKKTVSDMDGHSSLSSKDLKSESLKKEQSQDNENEIKNDIAKIQNELKEIREVVGELLSLYENLHKEFKLEVEGEGLNNKFNDKFKGIEKRVEDIENYLTRRRRGTLFSR